MRRWASRRRIWAKRDGCVDGTQPRTDVLGSVEARWEPPASAGGSDASASRKERTSMNRALAPVPVAGLDQYAVPAEPCRSKVRRKWDGCAPVTPALKRAIRVESLSRSAKALLPPHKCGGSHDQSAGVSVVEAADRSNAFASKPRFASSANAIVGLGLGWLAAGFQQLLRVAQGGVG